MVEQFVEQGSAFGFGGVLPERVEPEGVEKCGHLVEPGGEVIGLGDLGGGFGGFGFEVFELVGDAGLFLAELVGGDVSVIVELQEFAALIPESFDLAFRRLCRPSASDAVRLPPFRQVPANRVSQFLFAQQLRSEGEGVEEALVRPGGLPTTFAPVLAAIVALSLAVLLDRHAPATHAADHSTRHEVAPSLATRDAASVRGLEHLW